MATASARYAALTSARSTYLDRARDASRLTIPNVIPQHENPNSHTTFEQPYQSVGARGVASLSARTLLALFPPNLPFFRLSVTELVAKELGEDISRVNAVLAAVTQAVHRLMEETMLRPYAVEALRHLLIAGNVLLYIPDGDMPPRLFRLDQYVVSRDHTGQFSTIVVLEKVMPSTLPEKVRIALDIKVVQGEERPLDVYTVVERQGRKIVHWQEIAGKEVPGSRGSSPAEATGWLPLRWLAIPGSDYGRAHVTEVIGDLMSLEDATSAMVKFAAVASRIVHLVDPNSQTDLEALAEAETGDFIHGNTDDVRTLQLDKYQDFSVLNQFAERVERRVGDAFLLTSTAVRNADRVTAEEIRMVAEQLETTLGGTYSILSAELQQPIVRRYLYLARKKGLIPELPHIVPTVVTGFDAMGRAAEGNRLRAWLADLAQVVGNPADIIKVDEYARRTGVSYGGDDLDSLLKSEDERAEEQQQAVMAQTAQALAPTVVQAAMAPDATQGT